MIPFNKCPVCGGEVIVKEVEKLLRGGNNTAIIKIQTEVCLHFYKFPYFDPPNISNDPISIIGKLYFKFIS